VHNGCADWGSDASCASDSEDEHEHDEGGGANRQMFDSASSSESGSPSGSPGDAFPDGVTHTSLVAALPLHPAAAAAVGGGGRGGGSEGAGGTPTRVLVGGVVDAGP